MRSAVDRPLSVPLQLPIPSNLEISISYGANERTSREGDPLLHTHLAIANRIQGPDGRWTALDGRDLACAVAGQSAMSPAMALGRGDDCGTRTRSGVDGRRNDSVQATADSTRVTYRRGPVRSAE